MDNNDEWIPYQGYEEPKESVFMQVFDVLFILVLCYICMLIPILLEGKMLVG
jgi:hypothetical protein